MYLLITVLFSDIYQYLNRDSGESWTTRGRRPHHQTPDLSYTPLLLLHSFSNPHRTLNYSVIINMTAYRPPLDFIPQTLKFFPVQPSEALGLKCSGQGKET